MHWEKTIHIRITLRRIVGALVLASIAANLLIVGAAFGADPAPATPTVTALLTTPAWTATRLALTSTASETPGATQTFTPTETATETLTPTPTSTPQPTLTVCVKRSDWPLYRVARGDTLYSIALATGSTVQELKLANCLESDWLVAGQPLHVPRLPVTPTPTDTLTSPPPDTPATFDLLQAMSCQSPYVFFAVSVYDPEGILSVTVQVYSQDTLISEAPMEQGEGGYYGSALISEPFRIESITHYQFRAVDSFQNPTVSQRYQENSCVIQQAK